MATSRLGAYVDESIHDDHGLYVLAAVLTGSHIRERAQDALRAVLPADRLPHWHIEDEATRAKLVSAVAGLPVEARVYGCRFDHPRRAEAARARALTWFLSELDVTLDALILDRRQASQDAKDRRILASRLRDSPRTSYSHVPSASEPLLWVADIVAGAVCASWLRGRDHVTTGLDAVLAACEREPG